MRQLPRRHKGTLGMTLIEVICVVGIVASLAALLFPTFASSRRAAQVGVCLSNLQQCDRALKLYSIDYDDMVPRGKDCADLQIPEVHPASIRPEIRAIPLLSDLTRPYLQKREVWRCPLDSGTLALDTAPHMAFPNHPSLFESCGMSYSFITSLGLGASWTSIERLGEQMILADQAGHWHPGSQALDPRMMIGDHMTLWQTYRYNIAYFDGHVARNRTYTQHRDAWGRSR